MQFWMFGRPTEVARRVAKSVQRPLKIRWATVTLISLCVSHALYGAPLTQESTSEKTTPLVLAPVVIEASSDSSDPYARVTQRDIATQPAGNGNLTDFLKSNPAIRLSNTAQNSLTQGEIKPADVSIYGSLPYQNSFLLDGTSMNSDLDPARQDSVTLSRLGGADEQGFYVDAMLIDRIQVFDRNVPVEYQGFTGGVVDAQTRSWDGTNQIHVWTRATQGSWTRFIVDPQLTSDFKNDVAHPSQYQSDFRKRTYGLSGQWGLTENLGVVMGFSRRTSTIPIDDYGGAYLTVNADGDGQVSVAVDPVAGQVRPQTRQVDSFFSKATLYASERTSADLSVNWSQAKAHMFLPSLTNSDYDDTHHGLNITAHWEHAFAAAQWTTTLAYSALEDHRDSQNNAYMTYMGYDDNYQPYQYASGSLGNLTQYQRVVSGKTQWAFKRVPISENAAYQYTLGADWQVTRAAYDRPDDINQYQIQDMGLVMATTTRWLKGRYDAALNEVGVYGQALLQIYDWQVRAGLRLDRDSLTKDVHLAPRLSVNWDVAGQSSTVVNLGLNRYYGRSLLAYALARGQQEGLRTAYEYVAPGQDPIGGWSGQSGYGGFDHLRSPYADEVTLGVTQRWASWVANVAYVGRHVQDEVRGHQSMDGIRTFQNDGQTKSQAFIASLSQSKPWTFLNATHTLRVGVSLERIHSNIPLHLGYTEVDTTLHFDTSKVYYDGQLINAEDLDATDFNSPFKFTLETTHQWEKWGLTWYNVWRLQGARTQAQIESGQYYRPEGVDGPAYAIYHKNQFSPTWSWDTKLQYRPDWARGVNVSLEVTNVTNQKNVVDIGQFTNANFETIRYRLYDAGRQFWLQLSYDYR